MYISSERSVNHASSMASLPTLSDGIEKGRSRLVLSIHIGLSASFVVAFTKCPGMQSPSVSRLWRIHVAFAGKKPLLMCIDQWPGQEASLHEESVPSVVLYDGASKVSTRNQYTAMV